MVYNFEGQSFDSVESCIKDLVKKEDIHWFNYDFEDEEGYCGSMLMDDSHASHCEDVDEFIKILEKRFEKFGMATFEYQCYGKYDTEGVFRKDPTKFGCYLKDQKY